MSYFVKKTLAKKIKKPKTLPASSSLVRLVDYKPYPLMLDKVDMRFTLDAERTIVESTLTYHLVKKNAVKKIWFDGVNLELLSLLLNGKAVDKKNYKKNDKGLWLMNLPQRGRITIRVAICPKKNRYLMGLYMANNIFTTQCEAEGFRRISFYPDRPDVLSIFTVEILSQQPILLSNGNLVESKKQGDIYYAKWHDPFKKPCYLFALVAGDLVAETGNYITASGRNVVLKIWSEKKYKDRSHFALSALQRAMKWDEVRFGLEYDLDIFQIVGISDFNAGAMENKSLNIFNARYLLVDKTHNTDDDYLAVDSIIAHEYFHNWSGNRVTLRDWFQLSLKEGLTVFRDQEYSMDLFDRDSQRLQQVRVLRSEQFAEDASGLSHAVRPKMYKTIDNFYTATVYEKGAEVIRMLHVILGEKKFQRGIKKYIARHDGTAATIEDFIKSFEIANHIKLDWFMPWYNTPGTPKLVVRQKQSGDKFILEFTAQNDKSHHPLPLPLKISLFAHDGKSMSLYSGHKNWQADKNLFILMGKKDKLVFSKMTGRAVASINRGFSAPIKLSMALSPEDMGLLFLHDDDGFNRWQVGQEILTKSILADYYQKTYKKNYHKGDEYFKVYSDGFLRLLEDKQTAKLSLAMNFSLPSFDELLLAVYDDDKKNGADPLQIIKSARHIKGRLAKDYFDMIYHRYQQTKNSYNMMGDELIADDIGGRAINNAMLDWLVHSVAMIKDKANMVEKILSDHYFKNDNFTYQYMALCLVNRFSQLKADDGLRRLMLNDYFYKIKDDELQISKYIRLLVSYDDESVLPMVEKILHDKKILSPDGLMAIDFHLDKPNQVYALLGGLADNVPQFFRIDGKAYGVFLSAIKSVDGINSHVSARLINMFHHLPQLHRLYQKTMVQHLTLLQKEKISTSLSEMLERTLQGVLR
ncbi:MAG: aminopeptidase N [Alphaproteobacteria bacterium]